MRWDCGRAAGSCVFLISCSCPSWHRSRTTTGKTPAWPWISDLPFLSDTPGNVLTPLRCPCPPTLRLHWSWRKQQLCRGVALPTGRCVPPGCSELSMLVGEQNLRSWLRHSSLSRRSRSHPPPQYFTPPLPPQCQLTTLFIVSEKKTILLLSPTLGSYNECYLAYPHIFKAPLDPPRP